MEKEFSKFNWGDFYSDSNRSLMYWLTHEETLLSLGEILNIFWPISTLNQVNANFDDFDIAEITIDVARSCLSIWDLHCKVRRPTEDRFLQAKREDCYQELEQSTVVRAHMVIDVLLCGIEHLFESGQVGYRRCLPQRIAYLPLSPGCEPLGNASSFERAYASLQECFSNSLARPKSINGIEWSLPENTLDVKGRYLTYSNVLSKFISTYKDDAELEIKSAIERGALGVYLIVNPVTDVKSFFHTHARSSAPVGMSWARLWSYNSGNLNYVKRHYCKASEIFFERLAKAPSLALIRGEELSVDVRQTGRVVELESTDIESRLHITQHLNCVRNRPNIDLDEVYFIEHEVRLVLGEKVASVGDAALGAKLRKQQSVFAQIGAQESAEKRVKAVSSHVSIGQALLSKRKSPYGSIVEFSEAIIESEGVPMGHRRACSTVRGWKEIKSLFATQSDCLKVD